LALGFAQVDTDRDGFIEHSKVTRIYKQVCKLADAVYSTPVFPSERVGFLQWNNLFKNIPASDKHLAKALKSLDFLSFKDPGDTSSSSTKSYLDFTLPEDGSEENRKKGSDTTSSIPRKSSTGTPPNSKTVVVHSPPTTISSSTSPSITTTTSPTLESKKLSTPKEAGGGGTSKPRKTSNIKSSTPTPPLPTSKRPTIPAKDKDKRTGSIGLRPTVQQKGGRRSRANTGDSDVSAASSAGDIGDLDDIPDEEADFGVADADLPQSKSTGVSSPVTTTTTSGPATSPDTTASPVLRADDDDDDDTNESIIARANAVWS